MSRRDEIKMTAGELAEFLAGRHSMSVATVNHDGTLHVVAMWYATIEGDVVFWTYGKSQKVRNLERDPRVTCLVEDGESYSRLRGAELVGTARLITDPDELLAIGCAVHERYFEPVTDANLDQVRQVGRKRVGVRIAVDRVVSWDHTKLGGRY